MAVNEAPHRPASKKYGTDWWVNATNFADNTWPSGSIQIILLQEIRDELKTLNRLLGCSRFVGIPSTLQRIDERLAKRPGRKLPAGRKAKP